MIMIFTCFMCPPMVQYAVGSILHGGPIGKKGMFYLTTHSTYFILRLYGVRHLVKDHSDSERGNPLPPDGLLSD